MADVATLGAPLGLSHVHEGSQYQHHEQQPTVPHGDSRGGHLTRRLLSFAMPLRAAPQRAKPPGDSPRRRWVVEVPLSAAFVAARRELGVECAQFSRGAAVGEGTGAEEQLRGGMVAEAARSRCVDDAWAVVQRAVADVARQQAASHVVLLLVAVVPSSSADGTGGQGGAQGGEGEGEEVVEAWVVQHVLRPLVQRVTRVKVLAGFHVERVASQRGAGRPRSPRQQQRVHAVCAAARSFDAARVYVPSNLFTASPAADSADFSATPHALPAAASPPSPALIRALIPPQCALIMAPVARHQPAGASVVADAGALSRAGMSNGVGLAGRHEGSGGWEGPAGAVAACNPPHGDLFPSLAHTSSDACGDDASAPAASGAERRAHGGAGRPAAVAAAARLQQPAAHGQGGGQWRGPGREAGGQAAGLTGERFLAQQMRAQEAGGAGVRGEVDNGMARGGAPFRARDAAGLSFGASGGAGDGSTGPGAPGERLSAGHASTSRRMPASTARGQGAVAAAVAAASGRGGDGRGREGAENAARMAGAAGQSRGGFLWKDSAGQGAAAQGRTALGLRQPQGQQQQRQQQQWQQPQQPQRRDNAEGERWQGGSSGGGGEGWAEAAEVDSQLTQWLLGGGAPPPSASPRVPAGHSNRWGAQQSSAASPIYSPPSALPRIIPSSHTMPSPYPSPPTLPVPASVSTPPGASLPAPYYATSPVAPSPTAYASPPASHESPPATRHPSGNPLAAAAGAHGTPAARGSLTLPTSPLPSTPPPPRSPWSLNRAPRLPSATPLPVAAPPVVAEARPKGRLFQRRQLKRAGSEGTALAAVGAIAAASPHALSPSVLLTAHPAALVPASPPPSLPFSTAHSPIAPLSPLSPCPAGAEGAAAGALIWGGGVFPNGAWGGGGVAGVVGEEESEERGKGEREMAGRQLVLQVREVGKGEVAGVRETVAEKQREAVERRKSQAGGSDGEGERKAVAAAAARRWLMEELAALGVDSGEESGAGEGEGETEGEGEGDGERKKGGLGGKREGSARVSGMDRRVVSSRAPSREEEWRDERRASRLSLSTHSLPRQAPSATADASATPPPIPTSAPRTPPTLKSFSGPLPFAAPAPVRAAAGSVGRRGALPGLREGGGGQTGQRLRGAEGAVERGGRGGKGAGGQWVGGEGKGSEQQEGRAYGSSTGASNTLLQRPPSPAPWAPRPVSSRRLSRSGSTNASAARALPPAAVGTRPGGNTGESAGRSMGGGMGGSMSGSWINKNMRTGSGTAGQQGAVGAEAVGAVAAAGRQGQGDGLCVRRAAGASGAAGEAAAAGGAVGSRSMSMEVSRARLLARGDASLAQDFLAGLPSPRGRQGAQQGSSGVSSSMVGGGSMNLGVSAGGSHSISVVIGRRGGDCSSGGSNVVLRRQGSVALKRQNSIASNTPGSSGMSQSMSMSQSRSVSRTAASSTGRDSSTGMRGDSNKHGATPTTPTNRSSSHTNATTATSATSATSDGSSSKRSPARLSNQRCRIFTPTDLALATASFHPSRLLGSGAYGPVFRGALHGADVAVKRLREREGRGRAEGREAFKREVKVLSRVRHPHVVLLMGCCPADLSLVYEFMGGGSLQQRLAAQHSKGGQDRAASGSSSGGAGAGGGRSPCNSPLLSPSPTSPLCSSTSPSASPLAPSPPPLTWHHRLRILSEVSSALLYLHRCSPPIVHRDLKPDNILLDAHGTSKIADVGLACLLPEGSNVITTHRMRGTVGFIDPEAIACGELSPASDVYAFGVVALMLLTGADSPKQVHRLLALCPTVSSPSPPCPVTSTTSSTLPASDVPPTPHSNPLVPTRDVPQALAILRPHLDPLAGTWPADLAERVLAVAVRCVERDARMRADLAGEVEPLCAEVAAKAAEDVKRRSSAMEDTLVCPLSKTRMQDPVIAGDGFTYERRHIEAWLASSHLSPSTGQPLPHPGLTPNRLLLAIIEGSRG